MAGLGVVSFLGRHWWLCLSPIAPIVLYLGAYFEWWASVGSSVVADMVFYTCIVITAGLFHRWSWMLSAPFISIQLFNGLGSRSRFFGTILFQVLVPLLLFACIITNHLSSLHFDLETVLMATFYLCLSFAASFQLLFVYRLLVAKWRFERGQDIQHLTRDVLIIYSRSSRDEPSMAYQKAIELADNPAFKGFYVSLAALDEANAEEMVNGGALVLLFVLDPSDCKPDLSDSFAGWLRDEADLRVSESKNIGALKNVVYTPEGTRRTSFLRLKFAVFSMTPSRDTKELYADVPLCVDQYMGQFGALRLLEMAAGEPGDAFDAWTKEVIDEIGQRVANPLAVSPLVRKKESVDPYLSWFEFTRWLDSCPDCSEYHQYEVEKLRERSSVLRPNGFDFLLWWITSSMGRFQYTRSYQPFGPWDSQVKLGIQGVLVVAYLCVVAYVKVSSSVNPDDANLDLVHLFFALLVLYTLTGLAPVSSWLSSATVDKFKARSLLPPKYHFHQHASHYDDEVRAKRGEGSSTSSSSSDSLKSEDRSESYAPIDDQAELIKVRFVSPLFRENRDWHQGILDADVSTSSKREEILEDDVSNQGLVVNPGYRFDQSAAIQMYEVWTKEFVVRDMGCQPLCWLRHPGTQLEMPFQVAPGKVVYHNPLNHYNERRESGGEEKGEKVREDEEPEVNEEEKAVVEYLDALKPGLPAPSPYDFNIDKAMAKRLGKALKESRIIVTTNYWTTEKAHWAREIQRIRHELRTIGFAVIRDLLPKAQLEAFKVFSRKIWETMGGESISSKMNMQKCQWNDEPVARYLNHSLTSFVSTVVQEPVLHPGLALTIFIMKGTGFPLHMDSVPPFDLTLDLVVDHVGSVHRPVTFLHHNAERGFGVKETTVALNVGEAVIFRGSEMPHYGGDLPEGCYHNVALFTWSLARD